MSWLLGNGIWVGKSSGLGSSYWLTQKSLEYTSRSGLSLLETKSGSNLNAIILPSAGIVDGTNYLLRTVANFASGDQSGYVEIRVYYISGSVKMFSSCDAGNVNRYLDFFLNGGKPQFTIIEGASPNTWQATNAVSAGWHTIRFASSGTAYTITVDGNVVTGSFSAGSDNGLWFGDVTLRDNIGIGTVKLSTQYYGNLAYIDYVDYNNTNKWVCTGWGKYVYDIIGSSHLTWAGSAHIIYFADAGQYLLNTGYSIWKKYGEVDEYVPYASAGNPYNPAAFLTTYEKYRDYAGSATRHNKALCLIGFNETSDADSRLEIFDRSNTTRQTAASRASAYYSATSLATKSRYHSTELLTMDSLMLLFNTGYEYTFFPVQDKELMPTAFTGFVVLKTNMSGVNIDLAFTQTLNSIKTWVLQGTVLSASTPNDELNLMEVSMIYEGNPQILTEETNVFKCWHSSGWANPDLNYAESVDGKTWTRYGSNPIIELHCRSTIIKVGATYYLYTAAQGDAQIDLYTSADGITFTLDTADILPLGGAGAWDDKYISNVNVIIEAGTWYIFYEGMKNGTNIWRIGVATSPDGVNWTKEASNPIISSGSKSGPVVYKIGSVFYMWCHGAENSTIALPSDGYRYKSTDLISWVRDTSGFIIERTTADEGAGLAVGQIGDLFLIEHNNQVYLYYTATPDGTSAIAGQHIKLAIADMPLADLVKTEEGIKI